MNSDLRRMMVEAEGRFLHEGEIARVRDYALNMRARIDAARRLQSAEDQVVEAALERFLARHGDYARTVPNVREKTGRDLRLTLRYLAAAHVREDLQFFRVRYAAWVAELLRAVVDGPVLVDVQNALRESLEEQLDAIDARAIVRYLDVFIEELKR